MRRFVATLALLLGLASPLSAGSDEVFDKVMQALGPLIERGDSDGIYTLLNNAIRNARLNGAMHPDWAIIYAMFADHVRNVVGNPGYALQLADDGLDLIAGDPDQQEFSAALRVSRAYSLADLGRQDEAVASAELALPIFRKIFGDANADDLVANIEIWRGGGLSADNQSAADLARATLDAAYARYSDGEYARALALASTALLAPEAGLPEQDVRGIDTEAELLMADSLRNLGRFPEAANAYLRALGYITATPWELSGPVLWWGPPPLPDASVSAGYRALFGLAEMTNQIGRRDITIAALAQALLLARSSQERTAVLLVQASVAAWNGDLSGAVALLQTSRDNAAQAGDQVNVLYAEFYVAVIGTLAARTENRAVDPAPVIAATEALLDLASGNRLLDRDFLLAEAAAALRQTDAKSVALEYARQALHLKQVRTEVRGDTGYGSDQDRRQQRRAIETFLRAAHDAASIAEPDNGLTITCRPGYREYAGCLISQP